MDTQVNYLNDQCKIGKINKRSRSSVKLTICKSSIKPINTLYNKSVKCEQRSDKKEYENTLLSLFSPSIVTVHRINDKTSCSQSKHSKIQKSTTVNQDKIQSSRRPIPKSVKNNLQVSPRQNCIKEKLPSSPRKPRTVNERRKPRYENRERLYRYALLQNLGVRAAKLGFKTKQNWPQQLKIEFSNLVKKQLT